MFICSARFENERNSFELNYVNWHFEKFWMKR